MKEIDYIFKNIDVEKFLKLIKKNSFFKITLGIFMSVIIYYINYFINILGINGKIPLLVSIFIPLILLTMVNFISIIKLNEK